MLAHTKENFHTYPTQRMVGIIESRVEADAAVKELAEIGFPENDIDESMGLEGLHFLDPDGIYHGYGTKMIRRWQKAARSEEYNYLNRIKRGLSEGNIILSVTTNNEYEKIEAVDVMSRHKAVDIRFYGSFYVQNMK